MGPWGGPRGAGEGSQGGEGGGGKAPKYGKVQQKSPPVLGSAC